MSFNKRVPHSLRQDRTPPMTAFRPDEVPEGARDGLFRLVHGGRASKLRKRGVVLEPLEPGVWAWFESGQSHLNRQMRKSLQASLRRATLTPLRYDDAGLTQVKDALAKIMAEQRLNSVEALLHVDIGHGLDHTVQCLFDMNKGTHGRIVVTRDEGETDAAFRERVAAYIMDSYPEVVPDFTKVREPLRPASEFYDIGNLDVEL